MGQNSNKDLINNRVRKISFDLMKAWSFSFQETSHEASKSRSDLEICPPIERPTTTKRQWIAKLGVQRDWLSFLLCKSSLLCFPKKSNRETKVGFSFSSTVWQKHWNTIEGKRRKNFYVLNNFYQHKENKFKISLKANHIFNLTAVSWDYYYFHFWLFAHYDQTRIF